MDGHIEDKLYVNKYCWTFKNNVTAMFPWPSKNSMQTCFRVRFKVEKYINVYLSTVLTTYPESSNMLNLFPNTGENSDAFLSKKEVS